MSVLGQLAGTEHLQLGGTVACVGQGSGRNDECDVAAGGLVKSFLTLSDINVFVRCVGARVYPWNQPD